MEGTTRVTTIPEKDFEKKAILHKRTKTLTKEMIDNKSRMEQDAEALMAIQGRWDTERRNYRHTF